MMLRLLVAAFLTSVAIARAAPGDLDASFGTGGIVITAVGTGDA